MIAAATLPGGNYYAMNTDLAKVPQYQEKFVQIGAHIDSLPVIESKLRHGGVLIAQPPIISFTGVTDLNINTFDNADQVTITPFATTVLPWNIETDVDGGADTDRIVYDNVAGLFDDTHIVATGARAVFTGNVGCLMQVTRHLKKNHPDIWCAHPIDALWASYSGELPDNLPEQRR